MTRETFVYRPDHPEADENGMVPKRLASPIMSNGVAHHVISDTMDPLQSMADGKVYDSKSMMRAAYRAHGYEECGNDPAITRDPGLSRISSSGIEADVKRAIQELASR